MSENIRKRGNIWYYDMMIDGVRYKGTTKTTDKSLAEKIVSTIKTDILRQKHDLPTKVNYNDRIFREIWEEYLKTIIVDKKTLDRIIIASSHFLPVFKDKDIKEITAADIKAYQLQRKLEIITMPKNTGKRELEINFRFINIETGVLSNLFNYCIEKNYLDKNPATGIKKLNELSRLKTLRNSMPFRLKDSTNRSDEILNGFRLILCSSLQKKNTIL
jgi:hypothetical protein